MRNNDPSPMTRRHFLSCASLAVTSMHLADHISAPSPTLRFGVNYVPRAAWWYCWQDWDIASIQDDLHGVAALGMDHIRIQCLWPMFQPGINWISEVCVQRLVALLDAADAAGLDVQVTVLNGWMSGLAFMPAWVAPLSMERKGPKANIFLDPEVIQAEMLLFRNLAATCAAHRRFLGFDVGNEMGVLMHEGNPVTMVDANAWSKQIFHACNQSAPGKFHVNGVDHEHWLNDFGFSRETLAHDGSATVIHSYSYFTGALARYGPMGVGTLHLPEFLVEFAFAYHTDLQRPVWLEEIGVSPEWVPENKMHEHVELLVRNTVATGKLWGITWWCSHDLNPSIHGFNSLEYTLGLIDIHNHPKPLGKTLSKLAAELKHTRPAEPRRTALCVPRSGLSPDPSHPDWTYATAFMNLVARGEKPAIILEDRAADESYLRARGIRNVVKLTDV